VHDIGLDHQVLIDEFSRIGVIGMDTASLSGSEEDVFRFFLGEEIRHCLLVDEIQLGMGPGDEVCVAVFLKDANES
jgi:hypothetical protein